MTLTAPDHDRDASGPWSVPSFGAQHIARMLLLRKLPVSKLLKQAGLPSDTLENPPAQVDARKEVALLELGVSETGDALFAAEAGLTFNPRQTTFLSYVFLNSATIGAAIEHATSYVRLARSMAKLSSYEENDGFFFEIDSSIDGLHKNPSHNEFRLAAILVVLRTVSATGLKIVEIRFPHDRPLEHAMRLQQDLHAPVRFSCQVPGILLHRSALSVPIIDADPALLTYLKEQAERLLDELPAQSGEISQQVRHEIILRLSVRAPAQEEIAKTLGMSVSTLSRRLRSEGTAFAQLLNETRTHLAAHYLDNPKLSLSEISMALGYADQASFTNAYKRWTGQSPGRARSHNQ